MHTALKAVRVHLPGAVPCFSSGRSLSCLCLLPLHQSHLPWLAMHCAHEQQRQLAHGRWYEQTSDSLQQDEMPRRLERDSKIFPDPQYPSRYSRPCSHPVLMVHISPAA